MATTAKKNGDEKIVAKVNIELVNEETLNAALAEVGLTTKKPLEARVCDLMSYYQANYDEDDWYVCDRCGGYSVEENPHCPFCGDNSNIESSPQVEKAKQSAKQAKQSAKQAKETTTAIVEVEVVNPELSKYSERDLDDALHKIRGHLQQAALNAYDLGRELRVVYDAETWKLRKTQHVDNDGNVTERPKYTTFKAFVREELGISHSWAYNCMDVASAFSREQVASIGTTKLALALKAPPEKRNELIEAAKTGASKAELEQRIVELRREQRSGGSKPSAPEKTPSTKRAVAVPIVPGRKTVKLLKRPKDKNDPPTPAKKVGDQPWASVELGAGMLLLMRLQATSTGELQAVIEFRRADP